MGKQHAEIVVALFGDASEMSLIAGAVLTRCETEPTGESTAIGEPVRRADGGDHRGAGEQSDPGDGLQTVHVGIVFGQGFQLSFDGRDIDFEGGYLVEQSTEDDFQRNGDSVVVEEGRPALPDALGSDGNGEAEFPQEAAQTVDALSAGTLPLFTDAMELLNSLLLDRAHGYGLNALTAMGLEERLGIGAVGLAASTVRFDVVRGDEVDVMACGGGETSPIVCGTARLHQDAGGGCHRKKRTELNAR